jgi:hypothetical protein
MTLDATVGSSSANSYVDMAYAQSYFDSRLGSSAWNDESDDDVKATSLQQATRILDSVYDWNGWLASDTQALRWPRDGALNYDQAFGPNSMYDFDSTLTAYYDRTIVPKRIKDATCEMAIFLLQNTGYTAAIQDLKSVRVGPVRVDFNQASANYSAPNTVIEMLRYMGTYAGMAGGNAISTPSLVRT